MPISGLSTAQVQALIDAETAGDVQTAINAAVASKITSSQAQSLIDASRYRPTYVESIPTSQFSPVAGTFGANWSVFVELLDDHPLTVSTLSCFIGTASGNIDLGIYSSDGTTLTRLGSTGSTAAAGASAIQDIAATGAITLPDNTRLYAAVAMDNATVSIGRLSVSGSMSFKGRKLLAKTTSGFPLAASVLVSACISINQSPWIYAE